MDAHTITVTVPEPAPSTVDLTNVPATTLAAMAATAITLNDDYSVRREGRRESYAPDDVYRLAKDILDRLGIRGDIFTIREKPNPETGWGTVVEAVIGSY
jgi:hypothetical protein